MKNGQLGWLGALQIKFGKKNIFIRMIQPKYSPEEALQAIKLRMNYDSSKTLNENLNSLNSQTTSLKLNDYVFDFVMTENKKYVIYFTSVTIRT